MVVMNIMRRAIPTSEYGIVNNCPENDLGEMCPYPTVVMMDRVKRRALAYVQSQVQPSTVPS